MKKFLAVKDLNSPFLGGLSSYGLVLIIISFLNNDFPEMYETNGEICVSRTLAHLLFFYGKVFDPSVHMVNEHMMIT
jgi:DNA polymerase sigma